MARDLNKNRMLGSRIAVLTAVLVVLFSKQYWTEESPYHELFEMIGITLTSLCALGRVYSTAFLGGLKNETLITHGIYSVLRNPLYFFSLMGITGIALMSNHLIVMVGLPLFFLFLYHGLIKREQGFLRSAFGEEYETYSHGTPALIPNFSNFNVPDALTINPRYLTKSVFDAVWWFSALPIIELAEYLQESGFVPTLFVG